MGMTVEQKVLRLLTELRLINDVTLISAAMDDPEVAEKIINTYGDFIPDGDVGEGDCDHDALTNEEIQVVFDNDEDNKKGDA